MNHNTLTGSLDEREKGFWFASNCLLLWLFFSIFSLLVSLVSDDFIALFNRDGISQTHFSFKRLALGTFGFIVFVTEPYVGYYLGLQRSREEGSSGKLGLGILIIQLLMMIGGLVALGCRLAVLILSLILLGFQMDGPHAWKTVLLILPCLVWAFYGSGILSGFIKNKGITNPGALVDQRKSNFRKVIIVLYALHCSFLYTLFIAFIDGWLNLEKEKINNSVRVESEFSVEIIIFYWILLVLFFRLRFADLSKPFTSNRTEISLHVISYLLLSYGFLNMISNYW